MMLTLSSWEIQLIGIFYLALTLIAFGLFGADKLMAKASLRRISEKTLLLIGVVGGSFGALLGMLVFRHKIRKAKFWLVNLSFCALHLAILLWVQLGL